MLSSIMVKNFAIIDNISIDFNSGFTAITGETGAGKSLLIDAIGLLLGDRASSNMVRNGQTKAVIEGVFTNLGSKTKEILASYDLLEDDDLIIKKEIHSSGKSLTRVNGYAVSINQLEEIANTLADIHTQNDTKKLFEPKNYLSFIDNQNSKDILKEYLVSRNEYLNLYKEYNKITSEIDNYQKEKDYLEYQYNALESANLKPNELETLEEEFNVMNHFEMIYKNLQLIKSTFDDNNINSNLYSINNSLEKIASVDSKYQSLCEIVKNSYYELSDVESTIVQNMNHLEFDDNYFNEVRDRINHLKDLQYKYKKSINELIEYKTELHERINLLSDSNFIIEDALKKLRKSFNDTLVIAKKLTKVRKINAKNLVNDIKNSLCDLMLDKVQLEIVFNNIEPSNPEQNSFPKSGIDNINIMISFNPGEPMKELSKVASGGEMSRVMLAIKTHLMKNLELSTMIFDEIDSGVSGNVAYQVAKKLEEISVHTQVFSITHLPIVAANADTHLLISKTVSENATITNIKELSLDERIDVLANLISPNDLSEKSKDLAKEMLKK